MASRSETQRPAVTHTQRQHLRVSGHSQQHCFGRRGFNGITSCPRMTHMIHRHVLMYKPTLSSLNMTSCCITLQVLVARYNTAVQLEDVSASSRCFLVSHAVTPSRCHTVTYCHTHCWQQLVHPVELGLELVLCPTPLDVHACCKGCIIVVAPHHPTAAVLTPSPHSSNHLQAGQGTDIQGSTYYIHAVQGVACETCGTPIADKVIAAAHAAPHRQCVHC
jgi:hypothetical protein